MFPGWTDVVMAGNIVNRQDADNTGTSFDGFKVDGHDFCVCALRQAEICMQRIGRLRHVINILGRARDMLVTGFMRLFFVNAAANAGNRLN